MHDKLMRMVRALRSRVAWSEQEFNQELVAGKRRGWIDRIGAGGDSRCPRCGRRRDECNCPPAR